MEKDKAHYAVEGLPPSELAKTVSALEALYYDFDKRRGFAADWPPLKALFIYFKAEEAERRHADIVRILREEIATLALAYAELQSALNADHIQAEKYRDHVKIVGDPQHITYFLVRNFGSEVSALPPDSTIEHMVKTIMSNLKAQLEASHV